MNDHVMNFHATEQKFKCKICSKCFKSAQYLSFHEERHNKEFQCGKCQKLYPSLGRLNIHEKQNHKNAKSFECEICGKKFNQKFTTKIDRNHSNVNDVIM